MLQTYLENTDYTLEVIVKYHGNILIVAEELNAQLELLDNSYAILTLPILNVPRLLDYPQIEYVELPRKTSFLLQRSMFSSCISPVQRPSNLNLRGSGTVIGIIDSGIDYTHPDFRNNDGTTRILALWDQSVEGSPPQGFLHGTVYSQADINRALSSPNPYEIVPSYDNLSHGTAVAGVAAGNGRASAGKELGAAPLASLIIVKLASTDNGTMASSTNIMRGAKFVLDTAEALTLPLAINISYGANDGAHNGNSLFEQYLDSLANRWKTVISIATGNEATAGHHFHGRVGQSDLLTTEFITSPTSSRLFLTVWKNFVDSMYFQITAPSGVSTGRIYEENSITQATLDNVSITILYNQPNHYNGSQEVYILLESAPNMLPDGVWKLSAFGERVVDGNFDVWMPTIEEVTRSMAFLQPDPENTITLPATAHNPISVGGYNSVINAIANFSGRGQPYDRYWQKPDLVAPAVDIYSTSVGGGYDTYSGTSMAAPFVSGAAALMMEWGIVKGNDPFLFGQRIKSFLCKGANRDLSYPYPNSILGYGKLDLCTTMQYLLSSGQGGISFR